MFKKEQFLLIVLDACRYDTFKFVFREYIQQGELSKVWSPAACTMEWLHAVLGGNLQDVLAISGHGALSSKKTMWNYSGWKHFGQIIDVWDNPNPDRWFNCHPEWILDAYKANCDADKTLVWFMQPHGPFISKPQMKMPRLKAIEKNNNADDIRQLHHAYTQHLRMAMPYVAECIKHCQVRPVVVTSDHGELLGEGGKFWHPPGCNDAIVREVPWLEIS
jgi:hypothetical protein